MWNNHKCRCECEKHHVCEKNYIWNPVICGCENGKCVASIMNDSGIIYYKVLDADVESNSKTNFNEKKAICKTHILLVFLLINKA